MTSNAELAVDLTESYAHRVGDGVHLVMRVDEASAIGGRDLLQLRKGKRIVRVPVTATPSPSGMVLDAIVSTQQIGVGTWRLGLASVAERPVPLEARLIYSRKQPVALLPGPLPATVLEPPAPKRRSQDRSNRVYTAMVRVANAGLRPLPEDVAARGRSSLKKAERRLRG